MKIARWLLIILALLPLNASDSNINGSWNAVFLGPKNERPKTFSEVVLNLKVDGTAITGTSHMGNWPGDAEITDGRLVGDQVSFTVVGKLWSSSGYPKTGFVGTVQGKEMKLTMTFGFVGREDGARKYEMAGTKKSE